MRPGRIIGILAAVVITVIVVVFVAQPSWYFRLFHPLSYPSYITTHAKNYDVPPELVAAVIYQESRFNPKARSSAGATGLMQLTPETARGIAVHTGGTKFRTSDLTNPEINIRYGTWYLARMHRKYASHGNGWQLALAAYNAGQGKVDVWIAKQPDGRLSVSEIPYAETRQYVEGVTDLEGRYRDAYSALR